MHFSNWISRTGALLLILTASVNGIAQQAAPVSKSEAAVRSKIAGLSADAHISVLPRQSEEEFGKLVSSDQKGFTFYDIDRKTNVTFRYADVRKVKNGYGYNRIAGKHTDPSHGRIITVVVVGGMLVGLLVALAVAKN